MEPSNDDGSPGVPLTCATACPMASTTNGVSSHKPQQAAARALPFPVPHGDPFGMRVRVRWQVVQALEDALELDHGGVRITEFGDQRRDCVPKHEWRLPGIDRQSMVEVAQPQPAIVVLQL